MNTLAGLTNLRTTGLLLLMMALCHQLTLAQGRSGKEKSDKSIRNATDAFLDLTDMDGDEEIPQKLINQAEGIVIFPKALKVAFGVGGQGGRGFAIVRKEDGHWSNPYFVGMGEASVGAQIGVQSTDIILLFKHRKNLLDLEKGDMTLGGDVGLAAGPIGRNSSATTDIGFDAEIYSYSKSKGLYAGISLEGNVLKANDQLNSSYYEIPAKGSQEKIYYQLPTPYNETVAAFLEAVAHAAR